MRIRCPSCSATYEVPDALLERPRTVRCAKCAQDWLAEAITDDDWPEAPADPAPTEPADAEAADHEHSELALRERPPEAETFGDTPLSALERLSMAGDLSPSIRRRDRVLTAAWAASFAVLAALCVAGYTERDVLMRHWPASKRVYATLGLVQGEGGAADTGNGAKGNAQAGAVKDAAGGH